MSNNIVFAPEDLRKMALDAKKANDDLNNLYGKDLISQVLLAFMKTISTIMTFFLGVANTIVEESPEYVKKLASYGWYLTGKETLGISSELILFLSSDNTNEIDRIMGELILSNLNNICLELCDRYPKRKVFITKAIKAHKKKDYIVSIHLLFPQIDGICKQELDVGFFRHKKQGEEYLPLTKIWIENRKIDIFSSIYLSPLCNKSIFSRHDSEIENGDITRNSVLHGDEVEDFNELTSLKLISLLYFLGTRVRIAKEKSIEKSSNLLIE